MYYYLEYLQQETKWLKRFYSYLIEKFGPRTILKATMKQGVVKDKTNLEMVKQFYLQLEEILDLQLGKIVIAISSREELRTMIMDHDPPYLVKYKEEILECLHHNCNRIDALLKNFGINQFLAGNQLYEL